MRVLVTGATGFIGNKLVNILSDRGFSVSTLCRPHSDVSSLNLPGAEIHIGDILDKKSVVAAAQGCERVYHLAAYAKNWAPSSCDFWKSNVEGLRNVLEACLDTGIRRVVHTSTIVTFGPSNGLPLDELSVRTADFLTDYEASKTAGEKLKEGFLAGGLEIITVHPTRVFGPGLMTEANSGTILIALYLSGKWRFIPGDGSAVANYAFVEDVARGHILAMEKGTPGRHYILGGTNVSYNEFFGLIASISGRKRLLLRVPASLTLAVSEFELLRAKLFKRYPKITPGWARTFLIDWACTSRRAEEELGYSVTPLAESLAQTIEWIENARGRMEKKT